MKTGGGGGGWGGSGSRLWPSATYVGSSTAPVLEQPNSPTAAAAVEAAHLNGVHVFSITSIGVNFFSNTWCE